MSVLDTLLRLRALFGGTGGAGDRIEYGNSSAGFNSGGDLLLSPASGRAIIYSPKGFAADGVTNDRAVAQSLLDRAVTPANGAPQLVMLPEGVLKLGDVLHLGYGGSNPYVTTVLQGRGNNYVGDGGVFKGTVLLVSFVDRPAVAIQGGRLTSFRDATVRGPNRDYIWTPASPFFGPSATVDVSDRSAWRGSSLTSYPNSYGRYTPAAGVAVDPYTGTRPSPSYPDVVYPAGESSTQWGRAPSSRTTLEDVSIDGFEVGVVTMPSGGDGNGDFLSLWRCSVNNNIYAVSVAHTQGRLNTFNYCSFVLNHTVLTTVAHGLQQGGVVFNFHECEFGGNILLFDVQTAYAGPVSFQGCYGEQIWRLGDAGSYALTNTAVAFEDCYLHLTSCGPKLGYPATIATGAVNAGIKFSGGTLGLPGISVIDSQLEVEGTVFFNEWIENLGGGATLAQNKAQQVSGGILVRPSTFGYNQRRVKLKASHFWNDLDSGSAVPYEGVFTSSGRKKTLPWHVSEYLTATGDTLWAGHPEPFPLAKPYDKTSINSISGFSGLNATTGVGTIKLPEGELDMQPGDLLIDDQTLTVWIVTAVTVSGGEPTPTDSLCTVAPLNNLKDLTTTPVLRNTTNLTSAGNIYVLRSGIYATTYPLFGDFTASSATIDNVHRGDGYSGFLTGDLAAGDFLLLGYQSQGGGAYGHVGRRCRISSVSNTGGSIEGGTITMDRVASRSGTKVPLGFFLRNDN